MSNTTPNAPVLYPREREDPLPVLIERMEQLGSSRQDGKWQCPAHRDRHASLSISRARNGLDIVFHCFAGCSKELVREAIGWDWRLFYHPETRRSLSPVTRGVRSTSSPNASLVRTPSCNGVEERRGPRPDLATLEAEYELGGQTVTPVKLGAMPDDATEDMKRVAADIAFLIALFAAAGETRPLPYSARFGSGRMGWANPMRCCRALKALVEAKVIHRPTQLSPRNDQPRGTYVYVAPPLALEAETASAINLVADDEVDLGDELLGLDPAVVERDEPAVGEAVLVLEAPGRAVGMVTSGDTARAVVHDPDYNGPAVNDRGEEMPF